MNGPSTALAAVALLGPAGISACGPSMDRCTGDARTPAARALGKSRAGVAVRPERTATRVRTVCKAITFTTGLDGAAVRNVATDAIPCT